MKHKIKHKEKSAKRHILKLSLWWSWNAENMWLKHCTMSWKNFFRDTQHIFRDSNNFSEIQITFQSFEITFQSFGIIFQRIKNILQSWNNIFKVWKTTFTVSTFGIDLIPYPVVLERVRGGPQLKDGRVGNQMNPSWECKVKPLGFILHSKVELLLHKTCIT